MPAANRVIVAGTRTFDNYDLLEKKLDYYLYPIRDNLEIVSGCCEGADKLGELWAIKRGIPITPFPADWKTNNKAAGPIRNELMAKYATHLIAFHDGISTGTANMIMLAGRYNLKIRIVNY